MTDAAESEDKRGGRDRGGRFLPGHRLGGRPRGIDLRALVAERAGTDPSIASPEDLLWGVVVTLARRAALGDVPACRVLLDYLAAPPDAPTDWTDDIDDAARAERIAAILRDARLRRELDRQRPRHELTIATGVPAGDAPAASSSPAASRHHPLPATGAVRGAGPSPKDSA